MNNSTMLRHGGAIFAALCPLCASLTADLFCDASHATMGRSPRRLSIHHTAGGKTKTLGDEQKMRDDTHSKSLQKKLVVPVEVDRVVTAMVCHRCLNWEGFVRDPCCRLSDNYNSDLKPDKLVCKKHVTRERLKTIRCRHQIISLRARTLACKGKTNQQHRIKVMETTHNTQRNKTFLPRVNG